MDPYIGEIKNGRLQLRAQGLGILQRATSQMPQHTHSGTAHTHPANANAVGSGGGGDTGQTGGGQAHPNLQPSCAVNFIIALDGLYPSRN